MHTHARQLTNTITLDPETVQHISSANVNHGHRSISNQDHEPYKQLPVPSHPSILTGEYIRWESTAWSLAAENNRWQHASCIKEPSFGEELGDKN